MARTEGNRQAPGVRSVAPPPGKRNKKPKHPSVDDSGAEARFSPKLLLGVAAGAVVLALIVAVAIGTATEQSPADNLPTDVLVDITGDALVPLAQGTADAAIGALIPEVSSIDFDGNPAEIRNDGTPKIILFLAHWCQFCRAEVPAVQAYIDENSWPAGVDFVTVATAIDRARPNYPPNAWLDREGWTQRVVMDDEASAIGAAYGLPAFPYYVFVNGDGEVVSRATGAQDPQVIADAAAALLAGG